MNHDSKQLNTWPQTDLYAFENWHLIHYLAGVEKHESVAFYVDFGMFITDFLGESEAKTT